jgi:hypothetical protein
LEQKHINVVSLNDLTKLCMFTTRRIKEKTIVLNFVQFIQFSELIIYRRHSH